MYDVIIIGSGIAGLSAAIYARRFLMRTLVIGVLPGGLLTTTHLIENWPGDKSVTGMDLMMRILDHAKSNGAELINDSVTELIKESNGFTVKTESKSFSAKSLIIATGTIHRKLGVPGEVDFYNKGVSYCASCDAPLFKGKVVGVVGGGDSAVKEAILLSEYANKVIIMYRGDSLKAEPINLEVLKKRKNIEVMTNVNVIRINGDKRVNGVLLDNKINLPLDSVFVEIGLIPQTNLAKGLGVKLNIKGEIIIDKDSRTSIPGVFAAGDCTDFNYKQGITGSAQGVTAAFSAYESLKI